MKRKPVILRFPFCNELWWGGSATLTGKRIWGEEPKFLSPNPWELIFRSASVGS